MALEVEQHRGQIDARNAVHERVVGLEDEREAIVLKAFDHPALPQGSATIQLLGGDPAGQPIQLLLPAGGGQRRVAHVVLEVKARIVDPQRTPALQRRHGELLPVARDQVQARAHVVQVIGEIRWRALEEQHATDVHVGAAAFLMQEGGVRRGEPIQVLLGHADPVRVQGEPRVTLARDRVAASAAYTDSSDAR
jgi:threonine dehydratase